MTPDRLLAHYNRIADAPDAIARLRRFVLDLAVRGKLVAQDAADEPAAGLLKRIARERGMLRKGWATGTNGEPGLAGQQPFPLPAGWAWTDIGNTCSKTGSGSTPRGGKETYVLDGVIFLRSQNVHDDGLRLDDVVFIDLATHERMSGTAVRPGDLLLNITGGSIGRCSQVPDDFPDANVSQHVAILRVALAGISPFLHRLILSPYFQAFVLGEQTGAGRGGLPKNRMDRIPVALPPLAEQRRIVAKVDELMALCDRLEAGRVAQEAARDRLAAASLARLNTPDPDPASFTTHARFALNTLPALSTRADQIKALRQTILNLAVRGKLVAQNPNDNPLRLPTRRQNSVASELDEGVFEQSRSSIMLPSRWQIAPLAQLSEHIVDCPHTTPKWTEQGVICIRTNQLKIGGLDLSQPRYVNQKTYLERIARLEPRTDDILYSREGGILGIACRVPEGVRLCLGQRLMLIRAAKIIRPDFLEIVLNSPFITELAKARTTGGAAPRVNMSTVRAYPIPLPPLVEQLRIVDAVERLFALCDRLEAALATGDDARRRLLEALLQETLASPDTGLDSAA